VVDGKETLHPFHVNHVLSRILESDWSIDQIFVNNKHYKPQATYQCYCHVNPRLLSFHTYQIRRAKNKVQ